MPNDQEQLRPATREDVEWALSYALRYNGRKRTHDADEMMARIAAKRLADHLEACGLVVMQKPPKGNGPSPAHDMRPERT
jgi:hypothetical protein